jgi:hypothetical protein
VIDTLLNVIVFAFIGFLIYLFLRDEDQGPGGDTRDADNQ